MSTRGVTVAQWAALDATRTKAAQTPRAPGAWVSDVIELAGALADCSPANAKRAISDMQRAGYLDRNDWRVWLTERGRTFMEDGNTEGY